MSSTTEPKEKNYVMGLIRTSLKSAQGEKRGSTFKSKVSFSGVVLVERELTGQICANLDLVVLATHSNASESYNAPSH